MALTNIDTPPIYDVEFKADFENWLTTFVDQLNTNIAFMPAELFDAGGQGAAAVVPIAGMSAEAAVVVTLHSSTNTVTILNAQANAGFFTVNFSADPGALAKINYLVRL